MSLQTLSLRTLRTRSLLVAAAGTALLATACGAPAAPAAATPAASTPTVAATAASTPTATPAPASATIAVKGAWARSTPGNPNENSAGYAQVTNNGAQADRLVAASAPSNVAATVELHRTVRVGDQMKMEPVTGYDIAPGATLMLEPGGNHIMLLNLPAAMKAGTKIPISLRFERAPAMTVEFEVREATAGAMGGMSATPAAGMGGTMATPTGTAMPMR
jgi:copper(I)-binding protein